MASPWKFLARLISPGREQKRENGSDLKLTPDTLAISGPIETPAEARVNGADLPVSEELSPNGQAAAVSAEPVHEAENRGRDKIERGAAKIMEIAKSSLSGDTGSNVTDAHSATKINGSLDVTSRKRRIRFNYAVASESFSQVILTADELSLDEEIRFLRGQLARKLKLQNAQLRKMLERFERCRASHE
ncbi:hypothetical protein NXC14_PA00192 (plasmid) [Rhizobium sp. NXC14]|uniref:hypothetical protein n=1 Tax=Rhizobium sp. NXC14 TaxID=1981173 RepID=UPI000A205665|nr:hypothetical protein [Rhizobium sp. NXC14]ARO32472.1 hypothetical protein NXC14_PA00192 [Rhizobium sp. NXC14]